MSSETFKSSITALTLTIIQLMLADFNWGDLMFKTTQLSLSIVENFTALIKY